MHVGEDMKHPDLNRLHDALRRLTNARGGSIAPIFALAAIPLVMAAGSAFDVGRVMDAKIKLQDIADAAALAGATQLETGNETSAATKYVNAMLPGVTPTVNVVQNNGNGAGTVQVSLSQTVNTTFTSMFTPSVTTAASSTAQGTIVRNVTFTLSNFNSSASDLNQVYYYILPSGSSGQTLYQWAPDLSKSTPLLSNASGHTNPASQTVQIAANAVIGFALANTAGGIHGYGANCYGQKQGATMTYYSHREDSSVSYWDYNTAAFNVCSSGSNNWSALIPQNSSSNTISTTWGPLLANCNQSDQSTVNQIGSCVSSGNYTAGNYVYYTDSNPAWKPYDPLYGSPYSRNPLRYGTTNTDCTQGNVTYQWDDNGGGTDDNDYNDAVYTVNCTGLAVSTTSIRIIS